MEYQTIPYWNDIVWPSSLLIPPVSLPFNTRSYYKLTPVYACFMGHAVTSDYLSSLSNNPSPISPWFSVALEPLCIQGISMV